MKLSTILFTSLLGISSVASASPSIDFHAQGSIHIGTPYPGVVVRDHRPAPLPIYVQPVRPDPRPMAPPAAALWLKLGTVSTGTQVLRVDSSIDRRFNKISLEANGRVQLKQVRLVFGDGSSQTIRFDRTLTSRMSVLPIDLTGSDRKIDSIIVSSTRSWHGSITVRAHDDVDASAWSTLGTVMVGKQTLRLDDTRRFDRLAIAASTDVHLVKAVIRYGNGTEQVVPMNLMLTADMRGKVIDLSGADRQISSVTLFSDARTYGRLTVFAI